jgi:hypothetical protein
MPFEVESKAIDERAMCECGHRFALHCRNRNPAYRICAYHDANGKYCPCMRFRLRKELKPLGRRALPRRQAGRAGLRKKTKLRAAR